MLGVEANWEADSTCEGVKKKVNSEKKDIWLIESKWNIEKKIGKKHIDTKKKPEENKQNKSK